MCKEMRNIRIYMLYNIFLDGTMVIEKWYHGNVKTFFNIPMALKN